MSDYRPLYAIDVAELTDGRVDVRLTNVAGDDYAAVRTFSADNALYGADGGVELASWISDVVRDLYCNSSSGQRTDDQTRWIDQSD